MTNDVGGQPIRELLDASRGHVDGTTHQQVVDETNDYVLVQLHHGAVKRRGETF